MRKSRIIKQIIMVMSDTLFVVLAIFLSYYIRLDITNKLFDLYSIYSAISTLVLSILVFIHAGMYRAIVRYMGMDASIVVIRTITISTLIFVASTLFTFSEMPRSVPFIYWCVLLVSIGGSRFIVWLFYRNFILNRATRRVAIYGAGTTGRQLLQALKTHNEISPIFFIDNDKKYRGMIINGLKVYSSNELVTLIEKKKIKEIYLAFSSLNATSKKEIIDFLEPLPVLIKKIPDLDKILSGEAQIDDVQNLDIRDLLGRETVVPDEALFKRRINNKTVLVTGAGGSIGSELCRQIILHQPKQLILFELSEYALYSIEQEIKNLITDDVSLISLLGSVQDKELMQTIFSFFNVETVYHAAAYKHVPIVEENMVAGIKNNIFGTYAASKAALATGVEAFILISTDKAVRPTNVMGATKRFAELILQALTAKQLVQNKANQTNFSMVRFGNVLGSSGSVVPLFDKQIKNNERLTVTHPDITRYFMTIPEAVQLVLQSSTIAKGGDVFVLDMGEPVKIADLATKMIHLSGKELKTVDNPEGDIEIEYTGLRPGEKLYEELLIGDHVVGTQHPQIMRAEEKLLPIDIIEEKILLLDEACKQFNLVELKEILLQCELGYKPQNDKLSDLLWCKVNG
jgi:UDP-N-acetylglucosamine 4,6-dehydratase